MPIIIINGPLGVGKSTLIGVVSAEIPQCAEIDVDYLVSVNPPRDCGFGDPHYELVASATACMLQHHRHYGYTNAVVAYVFSEREHLTKLVRSIASLNESIYVFCLQAETHQLVLRVEHRAAGFSEHEQLFRLEQERERCVVLSQQLEQQHDSMFVGEVIHTDGRRVQVIAASVLERLQHLSQLSRTSLSECPERVQRLTFASKYVGWIVSDRKTATTRRVPRDSDGVLNTTKHPRAKSFLLAYDSNDPREPFAMLWVRSVVTMRLAVALTNELAHAENLADAAALRAELREYYTDLSDDDQVMVVRFTVVHWFRSGTSRICEQRSPTVTVQTCSDSPPQHEDGGDDDDCATRVDSSTSHHQS